MRSLGSICKSAIFIWLLAALAGVLAAGERTSEGEKITRSMKVEFESKKDKLNVRSLSVAPDDQMTCGDFLDFIRKIEEIAARTCDMQIMKEDFVLDIAFYPSVFGRVQNRSNIYGMTVLENSIELNAIEVMRRDENGKFLKIAENLGKVRSVDPGKPRLLYIVVTRQTKITDVLVALRELKLEPFVLSFMIFRDLDMHAL